MRLYESIFFFVDWKEVCVRIKSTRGPIYLTFDNGNECTERRGRVVSSPASYLGGPGFKYRP
jgi:hypothetical protein